MSIQDRYESGWVIQKATVTNTYGVLTTAWSTRENVKGRRRELTSHERHDLEKSEVVADAVFYTNVTTVLSGDRLKDPDSDIWDVVSIDNPHDLDKFLVITLKRRDTERADDT